MPFVRVFAAAFKPALAASIVVGSAAAGVSAWQYWRGDTPGPFERIQSQGQLLVIAEFGRDADMIVAVDPDDPSARTEIARIGHAPEYGAFATLSPDGRAIAYTALPKDTLRPGADAPAVAGIIETDGAVLRLADDVDLLIAPVWAPDSSAIVVRRNLPRENAAGAFELLRLGRDGSRRVMAESADAALFPIAFSPDGATLYVASLDVSGTDLLAVDAGAGGPTRIAHLSDEIARDWRLSPDGTMLAYTVAESRPQPRVETLILHLTDGTVHDAASGSPGQAEYSPAWSPDGALTMAALTRAGVAAAITVGADGSTERLSGDRRALDQPLAWSPDGQALAVRTMEDAPDQANHLEILMRDGERRAVSDNADVLVVGWLE